MKNSYFIAPKREQSSFTITHYAGKVTYDTEHFLPKNTDPLHPELLELMQGSESANLAELFGAGGGSKGKEVPLPHGPNS